MNRCQHTSPCTNEGTIFRDCTRGPMYDPRWFCEEHIEEAEAVQRRLSNEANIQYQESVVKMLEQRIIAEREKLATMLEELS